MVEALSGRDVLMIAPASLSNGATNTANLDTKDADWVTIRIGFAARLNTNAVGPTISLLESDDTTPSNFATIVANRTAEDTSAAKELRYDVDTRRRKRYLRLSISSATATNDTNVISAIATLTRLTNTPSNTAALVEAAPAAAVIVT